MRGKKKIILILSEFSVQTISNFTSISCTFFCTSFFFLFFLIQEKAFHKNIVVDLNAFYTSILSLRHFGPASVELRPAQFCLSVSPRLCVSARLGNTGLTTASG